MRYCHLELILSIILFLCGMLLNQVPYFLICFLDLVYDGCSWYGFPKYVHIYHFWETKCFKLLLAVALHDRWTLKLSRIFIYLSMAFNSYPLPNAYLLWIWSLISFLYTTEKYLHSTPCPWQVIHILVVEILDHRHFFAAALDYLLLLPNLFIKLLLSS